MRTSPSPRPANSSCSCFAVCVRWKLYAYGSFPAARSSATCRHSASVSSAGMVAACTDHEHCARQLAGHMQRHVWNCVGGMTTVLSVTRACAAPHCALPCPGATPAGPPPMTCPSCHSSSARLSRLFRPPCQAGRPRLRRRRPLLLRCCHCHCAAQQTSLQQHPGWRLPALEPPCMPHR
jgi:hypothetical protein